MTRRRGASRFSALTALWLVLHIATALAQESSVEPETFLFDQETVSAASKRAQPANEAPTSVTIIAREELRRFGYRTLGEALRSVPGFYTSNDRNYTHLGVRGFQRPGDFNNRILLLVNGHSINDDVYQHAPVGEDFGIDLEAVDRIEVVRGPGSALYGGNAFFAVINVITESASDAPGARARAEFGSYARKRGQASYGYRHPSGLDVFASASVLDVEGHPELFYPEYDIPAFDDGRASDVDGERALKLFAAARWNGWSLQANAAGRQKHIPTGAFGTTFNDSGSKSVDQRGFVELSHERQVVDQLSFAARVYYDYLRSRTTLVYGSGNERIKNRTDASSDWLGTELRLSYATFWRQQLTAGVEYSFHPDARQRNRDDPGGIEYLDRSDSFSHAGVYAQDEIRILPSLSLVAGVRFDHQYDRIDEWSPRVAGVWQPLASTTLKLLFGTAFRPPNLAESYGTILQDSYRQLASDDLDAEHITTYEGSIEHQQWGARFSLTGFHDQIEDLIGRINLTDQAIPTSQYRNRETVDASGFESSVRVPLPRRFALRSAYSFQISRLPDDRRLSNSPEHLGNLAILFPLAFGIDGATELLVIGPRDTGDGKRLDPVALLDLNFVYALPRHNLDFSLGFYNLLDREYFDPAGPEHLQDRIRQDGFNFRIQVGYAF